MQLLAAKGILNKRNRNFGKARVRLYKVVWKLQTNQKITCSLLNCPC